jgi:outer membrane immunogenic protein
MRQQPLVLEGFIRTSVTGAALIQSAPASQCLKPKLAARCSCLSVSREANNTKLKQMCSSIFKINSVFMESFMKKSFLATALLALTSSTAFAADPGVTAGVKFGRLLVDVAEYPITLSDGSTKGFTLGYDFGNTFSLDLELLQGEIEATADVYNYYGSYSKISADMDIDTTALYGTYRSEGPAYFLAKLGLLQEKLSVNALGVNLSESDSGLSAGIGGGFRFNDNIGIELEYTIIEQDINLLGLGLRAKF